MGEGGATAFGVLSRPLEPTDRGGVLICPSPGPEQSQLRRLHALIGRRLAAAGVPALRLVGRLEARGSAREGLDLAVSVDDARDAVAALRSAGVEPAGTIGVLLGGSVALLVALESGLGAVALWEPVVSGRVYLDEQLRFQRAADLAHIGADGVPRDPLGELDEQGWTWLRGVRLTPTRRDGLVELDLARAAAGFPGRVLLGSISRGAASQRPPALAEPLAAAGADVTLRTLEYAGRLGHSYLQTDSVDRRKVDVRLDLDREIADATVSWVLGAAA